MKKRKAPAELIRQPKKAELMKSPHLYQIAGLGKVGRPRLFADAKALNNACNEYFKWCIENPLIEIDFRGKDAEMVRIPKPRPFTLSGMMVYLGTSEKYWNWLKGDMEQKGNSEFLYVITRIDQAIRTQKFEYAAAGFFNANIISRDLGMVDKTEIEFDVKRKHVDELFPDENTLQLKANELDKP